MRRFPVKTTKYIVKQTYPIFKWCKCVICGNEFRREYGWKIFNCNYDISNAYVCGVCAESAFEALDKFEEKKMKTIKEAL